MASKALAKARTILAKKKYTLPFSMAIGMSAFPNTCACKQQECNKTKTQRKKVRKVELKWKEVLQAQKNKS